MSIGLSKEQLLKNFLFSLNYENYRCVTRMSDADFSRTYNEIKERLNIENPELVDLIFGVAFSILDIISMNNESLSKSISQNMAAIKLIKYDNPGQSGVVSERVRLMVQRN